LSLLAAREHALIMHEEGRRYLFEQWLEPERAPEFRDASRRLVEFFDSAREREESGGAREQSEAVERTLRNRMFHLIGASPQDGLGEFEKLCRRARAQLRLGECETLIKFVREYDRALTSLEATQLAYHEGKLAADRQQWNVAAEFYDRVLSNNQILPQLRAKTLCRLGMIYDAQRQWDRAIGFFERGLDI